MMSTYNRLELQTTGISTGYAQKSPRSLITTQVPHKRQFQDFRGIGFHEQNCRIKSMGFDFQSSCRYKLSTLCDASSE